MDLAKRRGETGLPSGGPEAGWGGGKKTSCFTSGIKSPHTMKHAAANKDDSGKSRGRRSWGRCRESGEMQEIGSR